MVINVDTVLMLSRLKKILRELMEEIECTCHAAQFYFSPKKKIAITSIAALLTHHVSSPYRKMQLFAGVGVGGVGDDAVVTCIGVYCEL